MRHHNLQVTGSVVVNGLGLATTADLNTYTASADAKISTLQAFTSSVGTTNTFTASASSRLNSIETISASNLSRLDSIEIITSSTSARLNSIETITSSNISRIGSLETISASNIARISSLETTSASVDTLNTAQNTRLTNLEIKTGSLATTGSNTFIGTQTITGSLYISSDLIVQGSSSLQNITASAVSIGTNIINLNTANPAIRYAGLVIGDSGSIGSSGSFFYDSVQDEFIFVHRGANTTVTSSVVLMGPQTYDSVGNETYLTTNRIPKGAGNEHLVDSNISDDGTLVTVNSPTASFTGSVGIGRTAPEFTLDVNGDIALNRTNKLMFAGGVVGDRSRSHITGDGNNNLFIYGPSSNIIATFGYTGNVGIGITNPSYLLDVNGTSKFNDQLIVKTNTLAQGISIWGRSDDFAVLRFKTSDGVTTKATIYTNPSNLIFETSGSARLTITSAGEYEFKKRDSDSGVILKTDSNTNYFTIVASSDLVDNVPRIELYATTSSINPNQAFYRANTHKWTASGASTEYMRITTTGNIGIGITTDNPIGNGGTYRNVLVGNGAGYGVFQGVSTATATDSTIVALSGGTTGASGAKNGGSINLELDGTSTSVAIGRWVFYTNNGTTFAERMRITNSGNVRPGANGTQDLGSASLRWGTIYTSDLSLSNGIGDYTIVEGEDDLFLYNNKKDKVYKFALIEVDPATATPKKS